MLRSSLIGLVARRRGITPWAVIATAPRRREIPADLPLQKLMLNPLIAAGVKRALERVSDFGSNDARLTVWSWVIRAGEASKIEMNFNFKRSVVWVHPKNARQQALRHEKAAALR